MSEFVKDWAVGFVLTGCASAVVIGAFWFALKVANEYGLWGLAITIAIYISAITGFSFAARHW